MKTLADNVKQLRLRLGYTQTELAERAGLSQPQISNIETGDAANPRLNTIRRLAEALGVVSIDLLDTGGELEISANGG